jgi:S-adenosylmethionine-dependent methyltransferase
VSGFAPGQDRWIAGLGRVRDLVRQTLVARQLAEHLQPGLEVLDVGCGQGTQAIALARDGHSVTGVDASAEMLAEAERAAAAEPDEVRARLRFEQGDALARRDGPHDLVCCHGVAMYLPAIQPLAAALVSAVRPGGLVSLLTRNRAGIAMRAGMQGDWAAALDGFDATRYTNRLGVEDARADDPEAVRSALAAAGAQTVAWYGVRLFCDHWSNSEAPDDVAALLAAEEQAGRRDPYRGLAALTHTIAAAR